MASWTTSLEHDTGANADVVVGKSAHVDRVPVELDTESESETVDPLGASRGILLAVALCVPFWTWVCSILF